MSFCQTYSQPPKPFIANASYVEDSKQDDALLVSEALLTLQTHLSKLRGQVHSLLEMNSEGSTQAIQELVYESECHLNQTDLVLSKWKTQYLDRRDDTMNGLSRHQLLAKQFESTLTSEISKFHTLKTLVESKLGGVSSHNLLESVMYSDPNAYSSTIEIFDDENLFSDSKNEKMVDSYHKNTNKDWQQNSTNIFNNDEKLDLLSKSEQKLTPITQGDINLSNSNTLQSTQSSSLSFLEHHNNFYFHDADNNTKQQYSVSLDRSSQSTVATRAVNSQALISSEIDDNNSFFLKNDYIEDTDLQRMNESSFDEGSDEELTRLLQKPADSNSLRKYTDKWQLPQTSTWVQNESNLDKYVTREKLKGLERIRAQASQLYSMFKELNQFVHDQQNDLDLFDETLVNINDKTTDAVIELRKANHRKKESRKRKIVCISTIVIIGLIIFTAITLPSASLIPVLKTST